MEQEIIINIGMYKTLGLIGAVILSTWRISYVFGKFSGDLKNFGQRMDRFDQRLDRMEEHLFRPKNGSN